MARHDDTDLPAGEITIAGRTFESPAAAAEHYGRSLSMYDFYRKKFRASFEAWVTGKLDHKIKSAPIEFEGVTYATKLQLCAAHDLSYNRVRYLRCCLRLRYFQTAVKLRLLIEKEQSGDSLDPRQMSLLKAVDVRKHRVKTDPKRFPKGLMANKVAVQFRGVDYDSYRDLCAAHQMHYESVRSLRYVLGVTFEEALTEALRRRDKREIRAFGTVYSTVVDLARHKKLDAAQLRLAIQASPEKEIEDIVRSLGQSRSSRKRQPRALPKDPVLFGWRFRSWRAAWEYWMPLGVNRQQFYDHLAAGKDIDARCQHEILLQAERGNLTEDLRKADQLGWSVKAGAPVERVEVFTRFSLPERLSSFSLVSVQKRKPRAPRGSRRKMLKKSGAQA